jgi:hypothetical protein
MNFVSAKRQSRAGRQAGADEACVRPKPRLTRVEPPRHVIDGLLRRGAGQRLEG